MNVERVRLGISSCLLGNTVRFDGGHKLDPFLAGTLGRFMEFVPLCPEVECGMGIPREAVHLVGDPASPRLVGNRTGRDWSPAMDAWTERRLGELAAERLDGFVFMKGSPTSGMERVRVYPPGGGQPARNGRGFFAARFMDRFPLLPVEDNGRLHDPGLRENFIERVFVMARWRAAQETAPKAARNTAGGGQGMDKGTLVDFHSRHKLLLMAHSVEAYRALGRLVAEAGKGREALDAALGEYARELFLALKRKATPARHRNVLQHCLGYFKKQLDADEKREALELIDRYVRGELPLIVPVTLVNHFVRKYAEPYLARQHYLAPHPLELKLRNHA
jgi:uncharacterized protein YbgA (DUF1722 family)/uncharacterized protein YbbK (DUF523 family)